MWWPEPVSSFPIDSARRGLSSREVKDGVATVWEAVQPL
jgi:hypothetical protein